MQFVSSIQQADLSVALVDLFVLSDYLRMMYVIIRGRVTWCSITSPRGLPVIYWMVAMRMFYQGFFF